MFTLAVLAIALGIAFGSADDLRRIIRARRVLCRRDHERIRTSATGPLPNSLPLQNAFSVLFFVSVGMLFDPSILVRDPVAVIAVLLALIIVARSVIAFCIVVLLRYPTGMVSADRGRSGPDRRVFLHTGQRLGASLGLLPREGQEPHPGRGNPVDHLEPAGIAGGRRPAERSIRSTWPSLSKKYGKRNREQTLPRTGNHPDPKRGKKASQHQLEMQQFIETFPMFAQVSESSQEELLLLFRPRIVRRQANVLSERVIVGTECISFLPVPWRFCFEEGEALTPGSRRIFSARWHCSAADAEQPMLSPSIYL